MPAPAATPNRTGAARAPRLTCAGLLIEYLKQEGVHTVFGIPGGPISPLFDALGAEPAVRTVSTRHEAGAAFMALGYARVTGRLGVCCLTTGPGTTNALTGVAAAKADSLPLLVLSAQVATVTFGKGSLQDSTYDRGDVVEMLRPFTKMSAMLPNPRSLGMMLRQAVRAAMTGRRGPVHLNIPTDFLRREVPEDLQWPAHYRPLSRVFDRESIKEAAVRLLAARRPAVFAGHGVNLAGAQPELRELAELLSLPVATTPKGKGAFPEDHPLSLRTFGLASSPWAEGWLLSPEVDVLLVLGSSLHEISTQGWEARLRPSETLIQQDVDPSVIGRNYPVDVALVGDAKTTLRELLFEVRRLLARGEHPLRADDGALAALKASRPGVLGAELMDSPAVPLKPQRVMRELDAALPGDALVFVDSGNNTLWAVHYLDAVGRRAFVHNWGEFGAMGYGVAASIGGKAGAPERPVVAVVGDGSFGMNGMEVSTAVTYGLPVVWVVLNDARYNAVHHGQQMLYDGRSHGTEFRRMDAARVAEGLGAAGYRVDRPGQLGPTVTAALAGGVPAVIDVRIDADEVPPIHSRVLSMRSFFAQAEG
ncbi:MAG: thiamine pyrophosphate-binding protein [Elusimicrobia bacterium]|nr:thiamine pyrophosphate-binding protein [Elusimicrobiota bacterium]